MNIDQAIDQAMRPLADAVSGFIFFSVPVLGTQIPLIVVWLILGGLFFTVYLRFVNIRERAGWSGDKANDMSKSLESKFSWMLVDLNLAKKNPADLGIPKP